MRWPASVDRWDIPGQPASQPAAQKTVSRKYRQEDGNPTSRVFWNKSPDLLQAIRRQRRRSILSAKKWQCRPQHRPSGSKALMIVSSDERGSLTKCRRQRPATSYWLPGSHVTVSLRTLFLAISCQNSLSLRRWENSLQTPLPTLRFIHCLQCCGRPLRLFAFDGKKRNVFLPLKHLTFINEKKYVAVSRSISLVAANTKACLYKLFSAH